MSSFTNNADWDWDRFKHLLPPDILPLITASRPPRGEIVDAPCRGLTNDGKFSLQSAYTLLYVADRNGGGTQEIFKEVWRWNGQQRVRTFLWQVAHHRLLTNTERLARGMTQSAQCPLCQQDNESLMHVLLDCEHAMAVWDRFVSTEHRARFFNFFGVCSLESLFWSAACSQFGIQFCHL